MVEFQKIVSPKEGTRMTVKEERLVIPDEPVVCYIEGDGVGREIMEVTLPILDRAVEQAYGGTRRIIWLKLYAGKEAMNVYGEYLPADTLEAIAYYRVALKGPLETPVGSGIRSLNVTIRQTLNLYACVRPVTYISGVPSPVKHPEMVNMVVFRENTEDLYAGIEWEQGSREALKVIDFLNSEMGTRISPDSGVGVKPISVKRTKALVRAALDYALANGRKSVTLVTKGNIMKFTEGAFRAWGYEVAQQEYGDKIVTEKDVLDKFGGQAPEDKITVKDRLADNMLQQILLYPEQYDVIATPNLNGDYISDALAAQVGGLGMAPGANLGDHIGVFEATHGTAPDIAGQGIVDPTALILSGELMLEYMGWQEAARMVHKAVQATIASRQVTKDLALQMDDAKELSTAEFGQAVLKNI
ncbi:MAG: isocitrate dehydrogenase (NADP(+)) [Desulfobacterales bacterium]|nr:MAG: isocitrate dehydrogenase (NADP(+)) [Desulfobacterales bacterium]